MPCERALISAPSQAIKAPQNLRHYVHQNLFSQISRIKLIVFSVFFHQLVMAAAFNDASVVKYHNYIGVLDGGKSVGNDKYRTSLHQLIHTVLYKSFRSGIDGRGRFVQNHDRRIGNSRSGNGNKLALSLGKTTVRN